MTQRTVAANELAIKALQRPVTRPASRGTLVCCLRRFMRLSFRRLLPESSSPLAPALAVGWMPGTSPGMTKAMIRRNHNTSSSHPKAWLN